jgi:hypothetical protein
MCLAPAVVQDVMSVLSLMRENTTDIEILLLKILAFAHLNARIRQA